MGVGVFPFSLGRDTVRLRNLPLQHRDAEAQVFAKSFDILAVISFSASFRLI